MSISTIKESIKQRILTNELKFKEYDKAEFLIECSYRNEDIAMMEAKRWLTLNGKKGELESAVDQDEYEELFIQNENVTVLQVFLEKDEIEVYANVPMPEHQITQIEEFISPMTYLYDRMNPHLEENATYINTFHVKEKGNTGLGLFYKYLDGIEQEERVRGIDVFDESDPLFSLVVKRVAASFSPNTTTKLIAQKNEPLQIKECTALDLINDIVPFFNKTYHSPYQLTCTFYFEPKISGRGGVNIKRDGQVVYKGKEQDIEYYPISILKQLYQYSEKSIQKLEISIEEGEVKIAADKAFPTWGVEAIQEKEYEIEPSDIETICKFIESGVQDKIDAAIEVAQLDEKTKARVEKRYLAFVQAQLQNPTATLLHITENLFSEDTKDICLGHRPAVGEDYVDFGYNDEEEAKRTIDFLGAFVRQYIDYPQFVQEIKKADATISDKMDLIDTWGDIQEKYRKQLRKGLQEETKLHSEGWWSKSCQKLLKSEIVKITTDKSRFYAPEKMPLLEEYMFFLNTSANGFDFHIDVYNSYMHELTEMYWMFRVIPEITWFQSTPNYPEYPFKHQETVNYRIDNDAFKPLDLANLTNV